MCVFVTYSFPFIHLTSEKLISSQLDETLCLHHFCSLLFIHRHLPQVESIHKRILLKHTDGKWRFKLLVLHMCLRLKGDWACVCIFHQRFSLILSVCTLIIRLSEFKSTLLHIFFLEWNVSFSPFDPIFNPNPNYFHIMASVDADGKTVSVRSPLLVWRRSRKYIFKKRRVALSLCFLDCDYSRGF